jgi:hypothetical protein
LNVLRDCNADSVSSRIACIYVVLCVLCVLCVVDGYAFYVLMFICSNRGPLQKVCHGAVVFVTQGPLGQANNARDTRGPVLLAVFLA